MGAINEPSAEVPWVALLRRKTAYGMLDIITRNPANYKCHTLYPNLSYKKVQIPRATRILQRKRRRSQKRILPNMPSHHELVTQKKIEFVERQIRRGIEEDLQREEKKAIKNMKNPKYFYITVRGRRRSEMRWCRCCQKKEVEHAIRRRPPTYYLLLASPPTPLWKINCESQQRRCYRRIFCVCLCVFECACV